MDIIFLFWLALLAVFAAVAARCMISLRKRIIDVEESKQNLKGEIEAGLKAADEERRLLKEELRRGVEEERQQWRLLQDDEQRQKSIKEAHEKAEQKKIDLVETQVLQLKEQLFQVEEGGKRLTDQLQKLENERNRMEEEWRHKVKEVEQHLETAKEEWNKAEKVIQVVPKSQSHKLEEIVQKAQGRDSLSISAVPPSASKIPQNWTKGRVKSFNDKKGYGFITAENGKDVFVRYSGIQDEGSKLLKVGDQVEFEVTKGIKGPQAVNVTVIG